MEFNKLNIMPILWRSRVHLIIFCVLFTASSARAAEEEAPAGDPADEAQLSPGREPLDIQTDALQNAVFDRPFVHHGQRASLGGYAEARMLWDVDEGINEGTSFEMTRFNLFVFAPIGSRMRFLSELEFEDGAEEIKLETAQLDVEIAPEFLLRAGIILVPLGAFNQNHDSPLWDFGDRPLVSTTIIPATFSEVGAGAHGVVDLGGFELDYQAYITQGLAEGVVDNSLGRTAISEGRDPGLMGADSNGEPALTGRLGLRYGSEWEVGLSGWHGAYNIFKDDGEEVDQRRTLTIAALDMGYAQRWLELRAELAWATIDMPERLATIYGDQQWGAHLDAVVPVWRTLMLDLPTTLQVGARAEYVDYNLGTLEGGDSAGQEHARATLSVALRPGNESVFRLNYGQEWVIDLVGNPPVRSMVLQVGMATYF